MELVLPFTCEQGKNGVMAFLMMFSAIFFYFIATSDFTYSPAGTQIMFSIIAGLFVFGTWGYQIASWIDNGTIRCKCEK